MIQTHIFKSIHMNIFEDIQFLYQEHYDMFWLAENAISTLDSWLHTSGQIVTNLKRHFLEYAEQLNNEEIDQANTSE